MARFNWGIFSSFLLFLGQFINCTKKITPHNNQIVLMSIRVCISALPKIGMIFNRLMTVDRWICFYVLKKINPDNSQHNQMVIFTSQEKYIFFGVKWNTVRRNCSGTATLNTSTYGRNVFLCKTFSPTVIDPTGIDEILITTLLLLDLVTNYFSLKYFFLFFLTQWSTPWIINCYELICLSNMRVWFDNNWSTLQIYFKSRF